MEKLRRHLPILGVSPASSAGASAARNAPAAMPTEPFTIESGPFTVPAASAEGARQKAALDGASPTEAASTGPAKQASTVAPMHASKQASTAGAASLRSPGTSSAKAATSGRAAKFLRWVFGLDKKRPGSGIPARPAIRALVWVRRAVQATCLFLFVFLVVETTFRGSFAGGGGGATTDGNVGRVRLPYPVEAFLSSDPFVAVMTFFSTHTVYRGLAWSIAILGVTVLLGRVFCGWICPFGTLHHFFGWLLPSASGRGAKRVEANKTRPRQRIKYYLLYAFLAASLTGTAIGGMLDPICVAVRSIGLGVLPASQYVTTRVGDLVNTTGSQSLGRAVDASQDFLARTVFQGKQFYFHQTWFILACFIGILLMNRFVPRFWCRVLCPLGALLGKLSRFAIVGMEKDHSKCTDCNLCLVNCQGADSPQGGVKWRQDECHMCMNCETACPEDVIKFKFFPKKTSTITVPDTGRRATVATAAAGAALLPVARVADSLDANYDAKLIRPPGSVEERDFLERCIRCAECMKVCPNNALHPAWFEAGVEGMWTPVLIPRIGYCEPSCVLCGDACPTGAIQKITEEQKLGIDQKPISIGTAFYDLGRCLPWAMATPCIVCEEFCPTSPKAIWVEEIEVPKRSPKAGEDGAPPEMGTVKVQRPHVDPSLCIGCGACEKACPVQDEPAVYVTSVGETRSKTNVILLENSNYNARPPG